MIVEAPGYRTLVTDLFDAADPFIAKDAVFGVRESLVVDFARKGNPEVSDHCDLPADYLAVDVPDRLARAG